VCVNWIWLILLLAGVLRVSNRSAIYWFLRCHKEEWFTVREVAGEIGLSIDRTRKHLTLLVFDDKVDTKVDGWHNIYRFRR
jgi:predicted ArsR family transcriptional regulator